MDAHLNKQGIWHTNDFNEFAGGNPKVWDKVNENLLKDSANQNQDTTAYMVKSYTLVKSLESGKKYTFSIAADLSAEKNMIGVWVGGGSYTVGTCQKNNTGLYIHTFTANDNMVGKTYINVYCSNNTGTQDSTPVTGTCRIHWIKIEEGTVATPWIPYEDHIGGTEPLVSADHFYEI